MDKIRTMGIISSRLSVPFFGPKNPDMYKKKLEKLNKEILITEKKKSKLQYQYKTILQFIVTYSRLLYVLVTCVFCFSSLPSSFMEYIMFCGPLIIFHIMVCFLKGGLKWYFDQEVRQKCEKIRKLKCEKHSILTKVKDTVTFKDAQEILNEFSQEVAIEKTESAIESDTEYVPEKNRSGVILKETPMNSFIDYIFGEDKNALICKFCEYHNGMALEEEYEYLGFRCCHCHRLNHPLKNKRT